MTVLDPGTADCGLLMRPATQAAANAKPGSFSHEVRVTLADGRVSIQLEGPFEAKKSLNASFP